MSRNHRSSRRKELRRRGVSLQTVITPDSHRLLLTENGLGGIANRISKITNRKLTEDDTRELIEFVNRLPESQFYKRTLGDAQKMIAKMFVDRHYAREWSISAEGDLGDVLGLDRITDEPTMSEYQFKEIMQYTTNENQFKHSAHHDRRGNAVVDHHRVMGTHSSPSGIEPKPIVSQEMVNKKLYGALDKIKTFVAPESIDERFQRSRQYWLTYQNIALPHQTLHLDSRNRLISHVTPNQIKWNIHAAGFPGQLGDNRIQDTLKEVIEMKVCPFWIPVNDITNDYYGKVHMLIKEFKAQSIQFTEFLDAKQCEPTMKNYHFEFDIDRRQDNRLFLIPRCDRFKFRKPFARVETITVCFFDPYEQIILQKDRLIFTVTEGNPTVLTSAEPHNLATGDLVYVLDYSSGDDALNREVNRLKGYIATRLNSTQISIPVDTTGNPSDPVQVFFGSKRVCLDIEYASLEQ